ncbi:MAG: hypothetical protein COY72_00630 [Candidatus Nealsonbacteria bacterium CG_4_10_14_0_8_um_filter_35_10]|uniref:Uncharacterized protein n=1 Tax=Candidatus Nealsonbacteria bacterium CG_4_10_14_0_8_um_filter_35_10 TaxID=1974683 RepID=A0A2M7R8I4_9BACT|nr:MAG: hypothetical protein AUJ24_01320 [Parcubacteria group bacterium CG1_02_36_42]PIY90985.1 MAG: hypothetical protein COY72_00630 [Candidatus Nealsonbacteria bacterium CG_4_10_14_0_8_um_filter_35_10]
MGNFEWKQWIPKIEVVASENSPLEIDLPKEEWKRLKRENLKSLKDQLSENAARRLVLMHGDSLNSNRYFLLVVRYGRCPV